MQHCGGGVRRSGKRMVPVFPRGTPVGCLCRLPRTGARARRSVFNETLLRLPPAGISAPRQLPGLPPGISRRADGGRVGTSNAAAAGFHQRAHPWHRMGGKSRAGGRRGFRVLRQLSPRNVLHGLPHGQAAAEERASGGLDIHPRRPVGHGQSPLHGMPPHPEFLYHLPPPCRSGPGCPHRRAGTPSGKLPRERIARADLPAGPDRHRRLRLLSFGGVVHFVPCPGEPPSGRIRPPLPAPGPTEPPCLCEVPRRQPRTTVPLSGFLNSSRLSGWRRAGRRFLRRWP